MEMEQFHSAGEFGIEIVSADGNVIADNQTYYHAAISEHDARRIVAAVNACQGIRTEVLEHRVHLLAAEDDTISLLNAQLATERASLFTENQRKQQLEQQVAELVGVLERIIGACDACVADDSKSLVDELTEEMEAAARAVIQKVRGGE